MRELVLQMGPMWLLAGLSAGWLAEAAMIGRGYGLIMDMGLGVGGAAVGGGLVLVLSGHPVGMLATFAVGFVLATSVILAQRLGWPCAPGAQEEKARLRLVDLGRPDASEAPPALARPRPAPTLARMATTGIYLVRDVPVELQRAARVRAASEGTTLQQVLLSGLGEYAAGTWTPPPVHGLPTVRPSSRP